MDSEAHRSESDPKLSHTFLTIVGGQDGKFYKLVHPGEPLKLTLVTVGSREGAPTFEIPMTEIKLKVIRGLA